MDIFNRKKIKELEEVIREQENEIIMHENAPCDCDVMEEAEKLIGIPIDFYNTDVNGFPEHPLNKLTEEERKNAIGELENIYHNKHFTSIMRYLIDLFGNTAIRSNNELVDVGRFSINGVIKLKRELENAHAEFIESHKPAEEYDKHEIISEVMK